MTLPSTKVVSTSRVILDEYERVDFKVFEEPYQPNEPGSWEDACRKVVANGNAWVENWQESHRSYLRRPVSEPPPPMLPPTSEPSELSEQQHQSDFPPDPNSRQSWCESCGCSEVAHAPGCPWEPL